jgi:hypothetical protein
MLGDGGGCAAFALITTVLEADRAVVEPRDSKNAARSAPAANSDTVTTRVTAQRG